MSAAPRHDPLESGRRPDARRRASRQSRSCATWHHRGTGPLLVAWPTKLALAPRTAGRVEAALRGLGCTPGALANHRNTADARPRRWGPLAEAQLGCPGSRRPASARHSRQRSGLQWRWTAGLFGLWVSAAGPGHGRSGGGAEISRRAGRHPPASSQVAGPKPRSSPPMSKYWRLFDARDESTSSTPPHSRRRGATFWARSPPPARIGSAGGTGGCSRRKVGEGSTTRTPARRSTSTPEHARMSVERSLRLRTDHVDAVLIHFRRARRVDHRVIRRALMPRRSRAQGPLRIHRHPDRPVGGCSRCNGSRFAPWVPGVVMVIQPRADRRTPVIDAAARHGVGVSSRTLERARPRTRGSIRFVLSHPGVSEPGHPARPAVSPGGQRPRVTALWSCCSRRRDAPSCGAAPGSPNCPHAAIVSRPLVRRRLAKTPSSINQGETDRPAPRWACRPRRVLAGCTGSG